MADIFSILGQAAAPRNSLSGTSIEGLEKHLRGLLESKVSRAKAERLSFTYEITSSARFTVSLSQSENDVLEGLGGIDPLLGGARLSEAPDGAQLSRVIAANDTIMNQPQDEPTLQRMVAKHIIGSVSAYDESSWAVREVSRGPQGWSFTYICKDSMQSWRRQNVKSMQNVVVGDYSEKERDLVSSSRPAFDCCGSVVISFSRGSRNITVKYKHTPFHKTVAELYKHFAPSPPPGPPIAATPKSAKSSRKRDGPNGNGEESSRKKSRKKSGVGAGPNREGAAEAVSGNDSTVVAGNASQPVGTPQTKPKRKRQYNEKTKKEAAAAEPGQQDGAAEGDRGDAAQLNSVVNVVAEEAARRREEATEILSNAGVDPETLSADQFHIFANQSPALQQESLAMFVEYGAERLRIVHPNKDSSTQNRAQSQTVAVTPASTAEASTTAEPQNRAPTAAADAPASRPKRPKVTRGSCSHCRGQKGVKCGRQKPACQNCIDAGLDCSYPLRQSRPKKPKSDAEVVDGPDETSMVDNQQDSTTTQISVGDVTMNSVDLPMTDDQLRPEPAMGRDDVPQFDEQNDSSNEEPVEQQDHDVPELVPHQTYAPPEPHQPDPEPYQELAAVPPPQSNHPVTGNQPYTSYDNFSRSSSVSVRTPTTSAETNASGYATSSSTSTLR